MLPINSIDCTDAFFALPPKEFAPRISRISRRTVINTEIDFNVWHHADCFSFRRLLGRRRTVFWCGLRTVWNTPNYVTLLNRKPYDIGIAMHCMAYITAALTVTSASLYLSFSNHRLDHPRSNWQFIYGELSTANFLRWAFPWWAFNHLKANPWKFSGNPLATAWHNSLVQLHSDSSPVPVVHQWTCSERNFVACNWLKLGKLNWL